MENGKRGMNRINLKFITVVDDALSARDCM
jgi:hypothetical protein